MKITTNQLGQYLPTQPRSIGDALHLHAVPSRTTMAKTFDGPPTLERSGSEHRRAVTSPLPEEEGLGEKVELSLQERRRGRKKPSLTVRKDG